jgi:hypothetical protein
LQGTHIGKFPSLLQVIQDDLCKFLLLNSQSKVPDLWCVCWFLTLSCVVACVAELIRAVAHASVRAQLE